MKRLLLKTLILCISGATGFALLSAADVKPDGEPSRSKGPQYSFSTTVSWGDEFNYTGAPDPAKWGLDEGNGFYGWGNQEQQYYTRRTDNAFVNGQTLKITAKAETYLGFNFTSAKLNTVDKRMFRYGRIEIRAKLPLKGGMWPAIFMFGEDHQWYNLNSWPECGEIDVIELNGNAPHLIHNHIHSGYFNYASGRPKGQQTVVSGNAGKFNNYRIDWTPGYIRWFINDVQSFEFKNDGGGHSHWPFDDWFNLVLALSVGGNFVGAIDQAALPQSYEIDYVRYYQLLGAYGKAPKIRPAAPVMAVSQVTKRKSESFTFAVRSKPPKSTIKWYANGSFIASGDSLKIPAITPVGSYTGAVVAVDNATGVSSKAVVITINVVPDP